VGVTLGLITATRAGNMWWSPRNVTETSGPAESFRRTEIRIERQVFAVELDGAIDLANLESCPMCGQDMSVLPTPPQLENEPDNEEPNQLDGGSDGIAK
jgi:hypothetical protein